MKQLWIAKFYSDHAHKDPTRVRYFYAKAEPHASRIVANNMASDELSAEALVAVLNSGVELPPEQMLDTKKLKKAKKEAAPRLRKKAKRDKTET